MRITMSVTIHIWKSKLPGKPLLNALYGLDVGHASMTIRAKYKHIYISHRPKSLEEYNQEKIKYNSNYSSKVKSLGL